MIVCFLDTETVNGHIYDLSVIFTQFDDSVTHHKYNLRNKQNFQFNVIKKLNFIVHENMHLIPLHKMKSFYDSLIESNIYNIHTFKYIIEDLCKHFKSLNAHTICGFNVYNDLLAIHTTSIHLHSTKFINNITCFNHDTFLKSDTYHKMIKMDIRLFFTTKCSVFDDQHSKFCEEHGLYTQNNQVEKRLITYHKFVTNDINSLQYHVSEHCNTLLLECLLFCLNMEGNCHFPCNIINTPITTSYKSSYSKRLMKNKFGGKCCITGKYIHPNCGYIEIKDDKWLLYSNIPVSI
jgi:hypothetical protein